MAEEQFYSVWTLFGQRHVAGLARVYQVDDDLSSSRTAANAAAARPA
jgi:hypothetical protein